MRINVASMTASIVLALAGSAAAQSGTNSPIASGDTAPPPSSTGATATATTSDTTATAGGAMTSDQAAGVRPSGSMNPADRTNPEWLLQRRNVDEYGVGMRLWTMGVPAFIVSAFAFIDQQSRPWGGHLGIAWGPEFYYRRNQLEITIGVQHSTYQAPATLFHGANEGPEATEVVLPRLFGIYLTSHFMWGIPVHRMVEFQFGFAIGVGYIGGDLFRSQAYQPGGPARPGGVYQDCARPMPTNDPANYCTNPNNGHYSGGDLLATNPVTNAGSYREPSFFNGGSLPSILPWLSIPQISLHIRPHQHFDIRIDGGFAGIGFYTGGALHAVF